MNFKENAVHVSQRAREEGIPRLRKVTVFYNQSLDLINAIEEEKARAEQLKSRDLAVRAKHSKKIAKTAKRITQLFNKINQSFIKKEIHEEEGAIFSEALKKALNEGISTISRPSCLTCHIQRLKALAGTTSEARARLSQVNDLVVLYAEYEEARFTLNRRIKQTRRDIEKAKAQAKEKQRLEKIHENVEKGKESVEAYQKAHELTRNYSESRESYLKELRGKRATELIRFFLENIGVTELGFPEPQDPKALKALKEILEKDLPGLTSMQVLEYASFNDKKLSHFTPEPATFKKLISKNHQWLSLASKLETTPFLSVGLDTDKDRLIQFASFLKEMPEMARELRELAELQYSLDINKAREALEQKKQIEAFSVLEMAPEEKIEALERDFAEYEKIRSEWFA